MTSRPLRDGSATRRAAAFTLVEAVVAMTILAIAGAALLSGIDSSLLTTNDCLERTIAAGMARQLLDEVLGSRYSDYAEADGVVLDTAHEVQPGPTTWETAPGTRERFASIGDFNGYRSQPPVDTWGVPLGQDGGSQGKRPTGFHAPASITSQWRQEVDVYYVGEADLTVPLPKGQVSDYRAVEVRIVRVDPVRGQRVLANLRQVVAYVPPLNQ